jgi:hypothetical protein
MPEDVAAAVGFLCLPESRQISAQTINTSAEGSDPSHYRPICRGIRIVGPMPAGPPGAELTAWVLDSYYLAGIRGNLGNAGFI